MSYNVRYKFLYAILFSMLLLTQIISAMPDYHNDRPMNHASRVENDSRSMFLAAEVWIDDDYFEGGYNDGHTWGYDAFDNIQDGVDNVTDSGIVHVKSGAYEVFHVLNRSDILIKGYEEAIPLVQGYQVVWDMAASQNIRVIIFVDSSNDINIEGFNFQGIDLNGRSVGIFYQRSTGSLLHSIISPNQKGNMYSLAVRAHIDSTLTVANCTIENYGRIGIYCRWGTTLIIENNIIIGQVYTIDDGDYVSYGIEVESLPTASHAQIRNNEIYNHNYIGDPSWSSAGIIIDAWRYYQLTEENCTATIEFNNIYDNMIGVQIVPNDYIHINHNIIQENTDFGAVSDPYFDGSHLVYYNLDCRYNWWGDASGPYQEITNPDGLGNEITDYVEFDPWARTIEPVPVFVNPREGFLHMNIIDTIELKIPVFITTLIIGKCTIEIEAPRCLYGIDYVEFYIDDEPKATDQNEPFAWDWNEKTQLYTYWIEAVAYDHQGNSGSCRMKAWKIQMRAP